MSRLRTLCLALVLPSIPIASACGAFGSDDDPPPAAPAPAAADASADAGDASAGGGPLGAPTSIGGSGSVSAVATDRAHVYWLDPTGRAVWGAGKPGKDATPPAIVVADVHSPTALAADDERLYIGLGKGCPKQAFFVWNKISGAGESSALECYYGGVVGIAADLQSMLVATYDTVNRDTFISAIKKPNTGLVSVTKGVFTVGGLGISGSNMYWFDAKNSVLRRADVDGGLATANIADLVADDTNVYWLTNDGAVFSLPHANPNDAPTMLASEAGLATHITHYGAFVYWTNTSKNRVLAAPKSGGAIVVVADGEKEPVEIAADADGVYWSNHGDAVVRMAPSR